MRAALLDVLDARVQRRRAQLPILEQPMAADERGRRGDGRFGAESRQRAKRLARRDRQARARARDRRSRGRSDARTATRARPRRRARRRCDAPSTPSTSVTVTRPCVSVPVLSNATHADRAEPLEMRAALDEHAVPRRGRQRRHDRHRRRDHERARTGDDEQRERAIAPDARARASTRRRRRRRAAARSRRRAASTTTAGVYRRANRSTNVCTGARRLCACSTRWMMRASVLSDGRPRALRSRARRRR